MQHNVLLVEDSNSLRKLYEQYLINCDINLSSTGSGIEAQQIITRDKPSLILLDLGLPDISGLTIIEWLKREEIDTEVIVITSRNEVETVVKVMQLGIADYIEKPFEAQRLVTTVNNTLKQVTLTQQLSTLQNTFGREKFAGFIGASLPMLAVYKIIEAAAPSRASVFITGESGTGKEVCARALHDLSERADGPFLALNCGAIPRELMESEIFGHVKGAFTGAQKAREGVASLADGGTLFLDEIAEMDMDLQTKLLRFIQTGKFQAVGSSIEKSTNIRFVCATNKDPMAAIGAGKFREDLYYRLQVIPIHLPKLSERGDDILLIAKHFLHQFAKEENKAFRDFSLQVKAILTQYDWPGNVRQLQNVMQNIVVLHNAELVEIAHLPHPLNQLEPSSEALASSAQTASTAPTAGMTASSLVSVSNTIIRPLAKVEREIIEQAIAYCDGNIPKAAQLLEVSPSTIYRKKLVWDEANE